MTHVTSVTTQSDVLNEYVCNLRCSEEALDASNSGSEAWFRSDTALPHSLRHIAVTDDFTWY
jgi:hypothetical protein